MVLPSANWRVSIRDMKKGRMAEANRSRPIRDASNLVGLDIVASLLLLCRERERESTTAVR